MKYLVYIIIVLCCLQSCEKGPKRTNGGHTIKTKSYKKGEDPKKPTKQISYSIKMRKNNGVYYVPIKVNGVDMEFIFDTGASDITISLVEAMFLYKQGTLTDEDIIGSQYYQTADGNIHEGTVINLKTVQIADKTLNNVRASVVDNMDAPLLLGQSALSKFGTVSIDYSNNTITFK